MSGYIGSRTLSSVHVGDNRVDKIYISNDLVYRRPTLLTINNTTNSNISINLNITKANTDPTYVELNGSLRTTLTTSGEQSPSISLVPKGVSTLSIYGGSWYFSGMCLGGTSTSSNNRYLRSIDFGPDYGSIIGDSAFSSSYYLVSIKIPNRITTIGTSAFSGCNELTSINIPSSVTSISSNAFRGCTALTSITVDSNNATYDSRNNCNAIIETNTNRLISGCINTVIPNNITIIGAEAFSGQSTMTSINIPSSVTTLEDYAFNGCKALTSVDISRISSIGVRCFYGCEGLTSINIPGSISVIPENAFNGCKGLTSITLNEGLTSIGNQAFMQCSNSGLTTVSFPTTLTTIGNSAFSACISLTSITIPANVTNIGSYAFGYNLGGMSNLTNFTFMHTASDSLTLSSNVFKVKTAKSMTVNYYGNSTVANYNYSGDNVTVTLNLLT